MQLNPKLNAKAIIEAGKKAARDQSPASMSAADRAVERAVGRLGSLDPSRGEMLIGDALMEIAKLHVREQIRHTLGSD